MRRPEASAYGSRCFAVFTNREFWFRPQWINKSSDLRVVVCLTIVCFGFWFCVPETSAQQQRPIDELIEMLGSDDRDKRRDAAHELADYGPEAVKALDGLVEALQDRDTQIWHDATQAIARLGPQAAPALDALIGTMDSGSEQRRFRTAHALGSIGAKALPAMRERLNHERSQIREVAVRAVGQMGPAASDAVPDLIQRLADDEEYIQRCAVNSLAQIGPVAISAVDAALERSDATIRSGAAKTLGAMGAAAHESLPQLVARSAGDSEVNVRAAAVAALGRVGPDRAEIIDPLIGALQDESDVVRRASVESWISVSPAIQAKATSSLVKLIAEGDKSLRSGVLLILNRFGPRAAAATPVLLDQLAHDRDSTELTTTLGQIGASALEPTYESLREQRITSTEVARIIQGMPSTVKRDIARKMDDRSPIVRQLAATTLGELVPFPRDGVQLLASGIGDPSQAVRAAAARSVQAVGTKAGSLSDTLRESITKEQDADVRAAMIHALASTVSDELGKAQLLECLERNLHHSVNTVRIAALGELANIDQLPDGFLEPLGELLAHDDPQMRSLATQAISRVKNKRSVAAELLMARLDDENLEVRQTAMRSLSSMGASAAPAIAIIQSQLDSESPEMQVAAIDALTQFGKRSSAALPRLKELSRTGAEPVRKAALAGVRRIAADPNDAVEILIQGLQDSDWNIRRAVARELGELEERASPAVPALLDMMRNEQESAAARSAIRNIGTADEDAVPKMLEILKDRDSGRRRRYYTLYLMRRMGGKAKSALPMLKELRGQSDGSLDDEFERAIEAIEDES